MIIVYYDGKCGLCSKEINHYRKIAASGVFDWRDVIDHSHELAQDNISVADGLRALHVKDSDGKFHKGVDGFILMWRNLGRWKWLAGFVSLPIIRQTANGLYAWFARRRFNSLSHCQIAAKQDIGSTS